MKYKHNRRNLILFIFNLISLSIFGQSIANYDITFESVWNSADHGTLPETPHWSALVGANHNNNISFLKLGDIATQGIEDIAETGNFDIFKDDEVNPNITNGNVEQFINGGGLGSAVGTISINGLQISETFPLITLVSMIAASPDWIITIYDLNLRSENNAVNNGWKETFSLDLFVYDAGTDDGMEYESPNSDIPTHIPISSLKGISPFNNNKVGTITFTYNSSTLALKESDVFKNVKVYPNPTSSKINITNTQDINSIEIYDVLGKLVGHLPVNKKVDKLNFDLSNLNRGIYLLKLHTFSGNTKTQKLIIQ